MNVLRMNGRAIEDTFQSIDASLTRMHQYLSWLVATRRPDMDADIASTLDLAQPEDLRRMHAEVKATMEREMLDAVIVEARDGLRVLKHELWDSAAREIRT